LVPPSGAKLVRVGGDTASGSTANRAMVKDREKAASARRWGFVCAIARSWKTVAEKTRKTLVTPVPQKYDPCTRVARAQGRKGRQTLWASRTRLCLRHVGDVPVVLRKNGRTMRPPQPKILVTPLAALTPSQGVCISQKRWAVERLPWERKLGLGVGEPQGSGDPTRRETSVGIAGLADVLGRRGCHHALVPGTPWRIVQLQHARRLRVMTNQVEHKVKVKMAKTRKAA
jgi:hypothetical protein